MSAVKILEGVLAAEEGATVYRKADSNPMTVTGIACSYLDKYGNRKEEIYRFIEVAAKASAPSQDTRRDTDE